MKRFAVEQPDQTKTYLSVFVALKDLGYSLVKFNIYSKDGASWQCVSVNKFNAQIAAITLRKIN